MRDDEGRDHQLEVVIREPFGNLPKTGELIQGVSVKVTFSPSMSQGLNLIKYW